MRSEKIYLSEWLQKDFTDVYGALCVILDRCGAPYGLLPYSKDIWCRDYMPVHIGGGKYVGFKYFPDYMDNEKERKYITEQEKAAEGLSIHFSTILDVVMDGGNYVRCGDKVVMTDKILTENPHLRPLRLLALLEDAFQAQVILIPWDDCEPYGHADGMVAYVGDSRILLNNYRQMGKRSAEFADRLVKILSPYFDIVELKYSDPLKDSWCYINYVETAESIILPALSENLEHGCDCSAREQIQSAFPDKTIHQVYAAPLIKKGGALHCVTWEHCLASVQ